MKERIEKWHLQGLWTKEMVYHAVVKQVITEAEYREITAKKQL